MKILSSLHCAKILSIALCLFYFNAFAQPNQGRGNGGGGGRGGRGNFNGEMTARLYGKVIDSISRGPQEYVIIRVLDENQKLLTGGLTERNGDFSIDKIPVNQKIFIEFSLVGYKKQTLPYTIQPSYSFPIEKDLGNIQMIAAEMRELVITDDENGFRKEFDKSIYDVEKNAINAGGTAEDVLRNIPVVQVDQDGNVSVRNTAPQIFVDGRPTTLTIDQIPADAIQKVEVITNPSAKYDASGGGGGIINIVMKKNRGKGYNGSIRSGINSVPPEFMSQFDNPYRFNGGIDFNIREGKFNFFANANLNQRRSIGNGITQRDDLGQLPLTSNQNQITVNNGYFARGNVGVDFLMDNRNTLTISQSLNQGAFQPSDSLDVLVDTLNNTLSPQGHYYRRSDTERTFQNMGTSALYKHLFTKEGTEFTADFNYNAIKSKYNGDYKNVYDDRDASIWQQLGGVRQQVFTFQMDFVSKINDKVKFEAGRRFSLRKYTSQYDNLRFDPIFNDYLVNEALKVDYEYQEQIEALYSTLSINGEKWKYQVGLRAESSFYTGTLKKTNQSFRIDYPISLFPSVYITRVLDDSQDIQLSVNRRINRPSFMQLSPFTDYSDSLNVSRGNPNLKPEFTHGAELSYLKNFSRQHTIVASAYARYTTNVTIKQQITEFSSVLSDTVIINTSLNAFYGWASGIEMVSRNSLGKWLDVTTTVNVYNSTIDGSNISPELTNSINSFWVKMNYSFKLPKNIVVQFNGDYASKKALDVGSSERGGGMGGGGGGFGGGGMHGGPVNTVQGFIRPNYGLDISIKKDFFKDRSLTVSLSAQDVLHTRVTSIYSASPYFIQDAQRYRDWQVWRFNVNWKFGKVDSSLFKRKNNKMNAEGMEG